MGQLRIGGSLQAVRLHPPLPLNFLREPDIEELRLFPSSFLSFPVPKQLRFGEENKQSGFI